MPNLKINTSAPYHVLIEKGILPRSGELCGRISGEAKICIVSDSTVHEKFGDTVSTSFEKAGFETHKVVFPPGEKTKSLDSLGKLLEYLAEAQFTRSDMLVALGGGVIGDLTGFAAAAYMRGIRFIQIPTTLLAAVDASVGGKTAIDLAAGKNLAGAFHQPSLVIFDPQTVTELPDEQMLDGLAEVIKSGVISDADLFDYVAHADDPHLDDFIMNITEAALRVKRDLVESDEHDTGQRQLLNLGHTMAHAIEKLSGYETPHGHAVAIGMRAMAQASFVAGWSQTDCFTPIDKVLKKYGFPLEIPYTPKQLAEAALKDKKRKGGTITIVIPLDIGECALLDIPVGQLEDVFTKGLGRIIV